MTSAISRLLAAAFLVVTLIASSEPAISGGTPSACPLPGGGRGACATQNCTICRDTGTGYCYSGDVRVRCPLGVVTLPPSETTRPPRIVNGPSRRGESCRLVGFGSLLGVCVDNNCSICRNPGTNRCYAGGVTLVRCPLTQIGP